MASLDNVTKVPDKTPRCIYMAIVDALPAWRTKCSVSKDKAYNLGSHENAKVLELVEVSALPAKSGQEGNGRTMPPERARYVPAPCAAGQRAMNRERSRCDWSSMTRRAPPVTAP